jgi:hypothetical protein
MKNLLLLFVTLLLSQQLFAQTKTWTGTVNTEWNNAANWNPSGIPTSTDNVSITTATNPPVISSGSVAAKSVFINAVGASLTINSGATLTVSSDVATSTVQVFRGTLTNNGTLVVNNANSSVVSNNAALSANNNSNINNAGTMTIDGGVNFAIFMNAGAFNNQTGGTVTATGLDALRLVSAGSGFTNATGATFTGTGTSKSLFMQPGTFTNNGVMTLTGEVEMVIAGSNPTTFNNNACAKLKVTGNFFNNASVSSTNAGQIEIIGNLNNNGTFTNNGVLVASAYPTYNNRRVQINNNAAYNGVITLSTAAGTSTINGIFTDAAAMNSAGTFTAPSTFNASPSLPQGAQTLYANITLSGATSCPYTVPFAYTNTLPVFTTQPTNSPACAGATASFTVDATNASSYQWQRSVDGGSTWGNLTASSTHVGVTTTTLTINNVFSSYGTYLYRCAATGTGGVANSNSATVIVNPTTTPPSTGTITWTGAVSTDWNTPCNWSPASVPTATNDVVINNVSNDPVIGNGTIANTAYLTLNSLSILTVNAGGTLNVRGNGADGMIMNRGTLTNNGTVEVQLAGGGALTTSGIFTTNISTINNGGTLTINATSYPISNATESLLTINNNTAGSILNLTSGASGDGFYDPSSRITLTNVGTVNSNCPSNHGFSSLTNSGTFNITGNFQINTSKNVANQACGKFIISGNYTNFGFSSNAGYVQIGGQLFMSGGFNNNSVLKYSSIAGSPAVTNSNAASVIVNNSPTPIFTYGPTTYNGTVNGIFTDAAATISAGTFTAPNTFVPSIAAGSYTLYAKITPSGGACFFVVPFTYLVLPVFTTQPANTTACAPSAVSLSAMATNANSYQWQISTNSGGTWNDIAASAIYTNVTTSTLNITNTTGLNGNQYRCVAIGTAGNVNSNAATLTVIASTSTPTGTLTWTGAISTDWNLACNWSPASVPTAGNDVVIPNTTNKPTIAAGGVATAKTVEIQSSSSLTIAATASLEVFDVKTISSIAGAMHLVGTATVHNNGSLLFGQTASIAGTCIVNNGTFNNNANATINMKSANNGIDDRSGSTFNNSGNILIGVGGSISSNALFNRSVFNNNSGAEIRVENSQSGITNDNTFANNGNIRAENNPNNAIFNRTGTFSNNSSIVMGSTSSGSGLLNDATFNNNSSGEIVMGSFYNRGDTFNNFGLLSIEHTGGQLLNRATFNNKPCGKAIVKIGNILNDAMASNYTNEGLTQVVGSLNNTSPAVFTNNGTLIYGSVAGTIVSATAPSLIVNNNAASTAIFTYGGTYNGTINGIFTDVAATISAGMFTAPNTFVPAGSLPFGSQTLYAKITPSGGACFYVVPFTFVVPIPAPNFTTQPSSVSLCSSTATSFSVVATNATSYQWQISTNSGGSWANVVASSIYTNVTSTTLNVSNITGLNGNQYRCVATGGGGSTNSNAATLLVNPTNLTLTSPADDINTNAGTKQAQSISATNKLSGAANVVYRAGNAVQLNAGFEAQSGTVFTAQIGGCN